MTLARARPNANELSRIPNRTATRSDNQRIGILFDLRIFFCGNSISEFGFKAWNIRSDKTSA